VRSRAIQLFSLLLDDRRIGRDTVIEAAKTALIHTNPDVKSSALRLFYKLRDGLAIVDTDTAIEIAKVTLSDVTNLKEDEYPWKRFLLRVLANRDDLDQATKKQINNLFSLPLIERIKRAISSIFLGRQPG